MLDTGLRRRLHQVARAVYGDPHELRPPAPVADPGRGVKHPIDTLAGPLQRGPVGDVAFDQFGALGLQEAHVRARADQGPDPAPAVHELFDDVAAQQPGTTGDQIQGLIGFGFQDGQ